MDSRQLLDGVEPELMKEIVSRRKAIGDGAKAGAAVMTALRFASVPLAFAALTREAHGQSTLPANIKAVLDFALTLEIFENEFYKAVLGTSASSAQNAAFTSVRAQAQQVAGAVPALQQIQKHEQAHVDFLLSQGATNSLNLTASSFDFTGARGQGNGPFLRATTELQFLLLTAQGAEDTGVRAYKGQAGNLISSDAVLEAALRIHSVEARHAAKIRRMRRATNTGLTAVPYSGTITGGGAEAAGASNISNPPAGAVSALAMIYGGSTSEANVTQAGVNVSTVSTIGGVNVAVEATEAFDEPLTRAEVVAIVQPFFIPTIS